jgi:protein-S-isoprenylcysteine O-methyltransferase Ste14
LNDFDNYLGGVSNNLARTGTWMQRWRVPLGFVCAALFLVFAKPRPLTLAGGGVVALSGLLLRAWAAGHIRKNDALAITGPYAYTRNPLYLGSFLIGLGFTIAAARPELAILFAVLFLCIYLPVMRVEATTLVGIFGAGYREYAREVPLFLPRLLPYENPQAGRTKFEASLYMRYREYRAALGLLIIWGILLAKAIYLK